MKLVLVRHGESEWNKQNLFTGWIDVPLSDNGRAEALEAGKLLKEASLQFDIAYTSVLERANDTLHIILQQMGLLWIPTIKSWRLNERHYGALQGLNKAQTAQKYGDEQVHLWRRGYDILPPLLELTDPQHPKFDARYNLLDEKLLPAAESLALTLKRVMPFWEDQIASALKQQKDVIIAAHGNSLRALIKYLEQISDDNIMQVELPTGNPLVYELDEHLQVQNKYYIK